MNKQAMVDKAIAIQNDCARRLDKAGDHETAHKIITARIVLNNQLKTTAGKARGRKNQIDIATAIFSREENEYGFESTVRHEFAHLAVGCGHGHDVIWRAMDNLLGGDSKCYHSLNVKGLSRRTVRCACVRCHAEIMVTPAIARKLWRRFSLCCRAMVVRDHTLEEVAASRAKLAADVAAYRKTKNIATADRNFSK